MVDERTAPGDRSCPICSSAFDTETELAEHVRAHGGPQTSGYRCPACGGLFNTEAEMAAHAETHSAPRATEDAADAADAASELDATATVAGAGGTQTCPRCGATFDSDRMLETHIQSHLTNPADARHICTECGAAFETAQELRAHESIHAGAQQAA